MLSRTQLRFVLGGSLYTIRNESAHMSIPLIPTVTELD